MNTHIQPYIKKHHDQRAQMLLLAVLGILDKLICVLTLGHYEGNLEEAALFFSEEDTVKEMLKAALRGIK
jgi:hypothetical protein